MFLSASCGKKKQLRQQPPSRLCESFQPRRGETLANSQQPTANSQQPTANRQPPTAKKTFAQSQIKYYLYALIESFIEKNFLK